MTIRNYHDLEVWQHGRMLVKMVYELTQDFPKHELYGLTAQLRRAAVSVPSNIAEGHSRSSTKDYIQFISMAIGSLAEVETQVLLSEDVHYVLRDRTDPTLNHIQRMQRMLHALRQSLKAKL